jgi:hypothetical protein
MTFACILTLLFLSLVNAAAPWSCKAVPAFEDYSYCVSLPTDVKSASKWPLLVFLSGSGARANLSDAPVTSTYSGVGYILAQHKAGNTSAAGARIEKNFVTLFVIVGPLQNRVLKLKETRPPWIRPILIQMPSPRLSRSSRRRSPSTAAAST